MNNDKLQLEIEGQNVAVLSCRAYEELLKLELPNDAISSVFHVKDSPRYQINMGNSVAGYYKILSARPLANQSSTLLSLHKQ
ncbi:hypothetical protein [Planctobacterium marinum]|uniref:hypothetical protein n=1 Tax=Planctobacterium marinum TaxID=1631968 RepID=UPI001E3B73F3|nr:hypothetical protein [Planctobacterium marinum]MCC2607572.1 hypothetical protein [Planctobacterium marinum]